MKIPKRAVIIKLTIGPTKFNNAFNRMLFNQAQTEAERPWHEGMNRRDIIIYLIR